MSKKMEDSAQEQRQPSQQPDSHRTRLTPSRLALLACVLARQSSDDPTLLVQNAKCIWEEAVRALEPEPDRAALAQAGGWYITDRIPFRDIAAMRRLPSSRTCGAITSANAVRDAVKRFYDHLLDRLETALKVLSESTEVPDEEKERLKKEADAERAILKQQLKGSLMRWEFPYHRLEELIEFQLSEQAKIKQRRKNAKGVGQKSSG
ncbi:MAG: hypothetical protein AB9869_00010 [Verrucomicrobiia bacterium]